MNSKLVCVLIAVAVVGIAECKPNGNLKARMMSKVAAAKRGSDEWPFGWFEYASLVGKCVSAINWLEFLEMDAPQESILSDACPKAIALAEGLKDASDADMEEVTKAMKDMFPLLQCVNIQAEREEVYVAVKLNGDEPEDEVFLKATQQLADSCEEVYETFEKMENKFEEGVKKLSASKRSHVMSMLERFLSTKKR